MVKPASPNESTPSGLRRPARSAQPIARLVPVDKNVTDSFGSLRGSIIVRDDIIAPDHDSWNAPDL